MQPSAGGARSALMSPTRKQALDEPDPGTLTLGTDNSAWRARTRAFPVASGQAPHRAQDPHPRLLTQDGLPCTPSDLFGKRGKELIGSYPMAPNVDLLVTGGAVNGGVVAWANAPHQTPPISALPRTASVPDATTRPLVFRSRCVRFFGAGLALA
jgi:hypothetical protein